MKRTILAGILILVYLVVGLAAINYSSHPSDSQQIKEALAASIQASREGKPGGVMDLLSKDLSFNGQDASGNLGQVADFIKKQRPDITVAQPEPIITGDSAQVISPVTILVSFLGQQRSFNLKQVILIFHRTATRRFLVFPSSRWELTEVRAEAPDSLDLSG